MRVSLVQQDIIWGDPEANRKHLDDLLSGIAPGSTDLIVLPEMFSTGFVTYQPDLAEPIVRQPLSNTASEYAAGQGLCETALWMQRKASELGCAIAGSIAVCEPGSPATNQPGMSPGGCFNRFHFVKPDGEVCTYDKKHLFAYGGEDRTFTRGRSRVIVEWRGVRLLLAVCYDLRFPVWLRNCGDYDGILLVANWPDRRRSAWDILKRARAIENQAFVVAVNRCGNDPVCIYDGGTAFVNPYGQDIVSASDGCEQVVSAEYDMDFQREYLAKFPVLDDADKFELI